MYKKFQADNIFNGEKFIGKNHVIICDYAGIVHDIKPVEEAGDDIQKLQGIISPGFINCHCHLELSHMKGFIPEKTGLVDFVISVVSHRNFSEEAIAGAIEAEDIKMRENGIVAVGDICNTLLTFSHKKKSAIEYYNFIESSGWVPAMAETRFEQSRHILDIFSGNFAASIVPHAPYSVSENLWQLIKPWFRDRVVSIHNQETAFEDELFLQNSGDFIRLYNTMKLNNSFHKPTGKSSIRSYFEKLEGASEIILVHNTFISQKDIEFIKNTAQNVWYCLCPNANLYIENTLPPVNMLHKNNCQIVIGTDSLASNHSLSVLDEMKTIQHNFSSITLAELLGWATFNGAKALKMDDRFGSLTIGKAPGLVLIQNIENEKLSENSVAKKIL